MNALSLLLVEDSPEDRFLAERALRKSGVAVQVATAQDGQEALQLLRDCVVMPALVLLDLQLPKLSGLQMLAQLRADPRLHDLTVVVLSSSNSFMDMEKCKELGVIEYLYKPLGSKAFVELLSRLQLGDGRNTSFAGKN